jgi:hypothetical protein
MISANVNPYTIDPFNNPYALVKDTPLTSTSGSRREAKKVHEVVHQEPAQVQDTQLDVTKGQQNRTMALTDDDDDKPYYGQTYNCGGKDISNFPFPIPAPFADSIRICDDSVQLGELTFLRTQYFLRNLE